MTALDRAHAFALPTRADGVPWPAQHWPQGPLDGDVRRWLSSVLDRFPTA